MTETPYRPSGDRHHVVVIGSGIGGMSAVRELNGADVDITLIDRTNHHLFPPLLYQVATGILSPGEIAPQTRQYLRRQDNVDIVQGNVTDIDVTAQTVTAELGDKSRSFAYDSLVVAAGAGQSYFGNDHFAEFAPGMKTIDDALHIRARVINAFEQAELTEDPAERERLLTFVIVGAGPTGVELAGQLAEMANRTLKNEFSHFNSSAARIYLLDGMAQVLPPFGKRLGRNAQRNLEKNGVIVKLNAMVTNIDADSVTYKSTKDDTEHTIQAPFKIWSAGVAASPLGKMIADQAGVEADRAGRVPVNADLSVGELKNVFVIGDMMGHPDRLPGVAQTAIQGGAYVAHNLAKEVDGEQSPEQREAFDYFDKGSMAIVSRFAAVVKMGKVEVTGFLGWVMWLGVHLAFLPGVRNRLFTVLNTGINVLSRDRSNLEVTAKQWKSAYGEDQR